MRFRGNDVVLFHIVDSRELDPGFKGPVLLQDLETKVAVEVSPEYANNEYRARFRNHMDAIRTQAQRTGLDYCLMDTSVPLDQGLRRYLTIRQGRQ